MAQPLTTNNNWTYYGQSGTNDYLFAIEHTPTGGNTMPFTASINLKKICNSNNVYKVTDISNKEGTFIAGYYWNIALTNGNTNGYVNIRFFPDQTDNNALETIANNFFTSSGALYNSPSVYFKTNNILILPTDIRTDAKGLNYGFSPLLVNETGIYESKNYVQFNSINNINNSGGGLLRRVTNLNENSFSTAAQAIDLKGSLRYNPSSDKFEGFNGIQWTPLH